MTDEEILACAKGPASITDTRYPPPNNVFTTKIRWSACWCFSRGRDQAILDPQPLYHDATRSMGWYDEFRKQREGIVVPPIELDSADAKTVKKLARKYGADATEVIAVLVEAATHKKAEALARALNKREIELEKQAK